MNVAGFRLAARSPAAPLTVADWRERARRRLPDMVWAYLENGADGERTLRDNRTALDAWAVRQRVLSGVPDPDLTTTVAGSELAIPVLGAPMGLLGAAHWHGDLGVARAAERRGTRLVLTSASTYSLVEVAEQTRQSHWFQLYPWGDRELTGTLVRRAEDAGYGALVVTVDVPVLGNRLGEQRRGMAMPPTLSPARVAHALTRPQWCYGYARYRRTTLRNLQPPGTRGAVRSVAAQSARLGGRLDWDDLDWLRAQWSGPLLVKGVLEPEDAERCVELGADGIVVSNHGGRQLDGAPAAIEALPAVVEQVGSRAEVLVDGGIRTGLDVIVALALGARACLVGRPLAYGLAGGGTHGAADVLRILRDELRRGLTLMGLSSAAQLDQSSIRLRGTPAARPTVGSAAPILNGAATEAS